MNVLEAARVIRMAAQPGRNPDTGQAACCGTPAFSPHAPGCAWLSWDQIVAALEILDRISRDEHEDGCLVPTTILMWCFCSQRMAQAAFGGGEATR